MNPTDKVYSDFSLGDYVVFKRTYTEKDFQTFSKLSGDTNPLHHDPSYAAKTKFDHTIVPLHLIASPLSAIAGTMIPGHRSLYLNTSIRAIEPAPYNKELTYSAKVVAKQDTNKIISLRVLVLGEKTVYLEANLNIQVRGDIEPDSYKENEKNPISNANRNRFALVTGAGGHIARAIAKRLVNDGWNLALQYRTKNEAIENVVKLAKKKGAKIHEVVGDFSDSQQCEQIINSLKTLPRISTLIHTASPPLESSITDLINVNFYALDKMVDTLIPDMLCAQQGKIVLLGSGALQYHPPGWSNYIAAKSAATSFIEGVHKQFSTYGIKGHTLALGYVQTPFSDLCRNKEQIHLLPEEVADEVASIAQNTKSTATCTWLEPSFRREGHYGFNEYAQSPVAQKETRPSSSKTTVHDKSKDSVENLFLRFFDLDNTIETSQQKVGITPGWDSLSHIEFLLHLEKVLSIQFSSAEMDRTTQYIELEKLVSEKSL
jgi:3-oxoacyl-[acyl-carrier protein] reductase